MDLQSNLYDRRKDYLFIASFIIGGFLILNTIIIYLTGGVPSVLAHTMYIPVLLTAFFYGVRKTIFIAILAGLLVGPLMQLNVLDVSVEPWANSLYRIGYLVVIGSLVALLFSKLQSRLEYVHVQAEELKATLMSIGDGVVTTDRFGNIKSLNKVAESLLAQDEAVVLNKAFDEIFVMINEETRQPIKNPIAKVLKTNVPVKLKTPSILINAKGQEYHIEESAMPILSKEKALIGVVLVFRDVSERVELDRKLFLGRQRLSQVVESSADIIFEIDLNLRYVSIYGKGLKKINHQTNFFINKTVIDAFGNDGQSRMEFYKKALGGETVFYEWEYIQGEETIYFESSISPIYDVNKKIIGAAGITRDITEKKLKQKEIEHISFHDYLTSLYNRRYFAEALIKYDESFYLPLGIMMIDFNGLKIINDAFGHDVGDRTLKAVAKLLQKAKREVDVLARIGGDEFALIMPNVTNKTIDVIKEEIMAIMKTRKIRNIDLSLSIGYAIKENKKEAVSDVLKNAENEMYRRKLIEGISARNNSIKAILKTLTKKYNEERIHSERVSNLCELTGIALNLQKDDIKELKMAGMYHDIGKISLPDAILKKPGKLTKEEFEVVKEHTKNGYQILRAADDYSVLAQTVLYHHEWYDGNGYPEGLKGEKIPPYSRIISVVDAYEAMTSNRPYSKARSHDEAIEELKRCAGTQFDPKIVDVFVNNVKPGT